MPSLRPLSLAIRAAGRSKVNWRVACPDARTIIRRRSCSAPHQLQQTVTVSPEAHTNAQLNPTTADPPTPPTDHRTLAQAHNLFITSPYSPGSPLILPNGAYIFQKLQSFLRAQYPQFGFQEVITPIIYKKSLWEKSGHWENYAEDMFSVQGRGATGQTDCAQVGEDEEFGLKPMNCPGHCLLFRDEIKSYRDLPIRYADFSALHRNEVSGSLTGLTRVRRFHQDDAHIFCRPDQILSEIEQTLKFVGMVYKTFGLGPYKLLLSTRPKESFIGTIEEWDRAEQQLSAALDSTGREWAIDQGNGAFYGPKIDIILKDSNGKEHQTATIQLDFQLPQRFDLQYQASPEELNTTTQPSTNRSLDPSLRRPVMIHRAIYGSIERFMALLIEHYAGHYPFWLSPRPATILSLNEDPKIQSHTQRVKKILSGLEPPSPTPSPSPSPSSPTPTPTPLSTTYLPLTTDTSPRPLGKKIQEARLKKFNHVIVIGAQEAAADQISLKIAHQHDLPAALAVLGETLGRVVTEGQVQRGVGMSVYEGRRYFEKLVEGYL